MITIPKGTKDVLPDKSAKWRYVEDTLRRTARDFGFKEIRFPTFEHTELFLRGVGDTTDVVQKEMYTFEDKGGRSITLRPEGTASVVRSVVENGLYAGVLPLKVYYIAPNFRYEKPQAGRLREHHQFGVEYFGASSYTADAEVIGLADTFLRRLGINNISVSINSIGCPTCRKAYNAALKEYFAGHLGEMCETCKDRFERNPLRLLDCKEAHCGEIAKSAPHTVDYLCDDCKAHFDGLKRTLELTGIDYTVDTRIVRGLDYYSRTVFEFVSKDIGAQATVCGGGRYDGLVKTLGGPELAGLGFGSGIERLLMVMDALGIETPCDDRPDIFVAGAGAESEDTLRRLVWGLRRVGVAAEADTTGRSLKAQMKYADKLGARYTLIIGATEIENGSAMIKNMSTGEQTQTELTPEAVAAVVADRSDR